MVCHIDRELQSENNGARNVTTEIHSCPSHTVITAGIYNVKEWEVFFKLLLERRE